MVLYLRAHNPVLRGPTAVLHLQGAFAGPEDDQGPGGGSGGGVSLLSQLGPGAGGKADTQQPAEPAEPTVRARMPPCQGPGRRRPWSREL